MFTIAAFASLLALAGSALAQEGGSAASVAQLVAQLRQAPTEVDRFRTLTDEQFLFDFVNPNTTVGVTNGAGGHTVAATSANFPAVIGQGVSMTIGFLGPCGMNSPHTHPRATEINFSINTTLRGGVLVENGARFAEIDIRPGTATVFPQGAIHFEMNPSCEPAMFVAGFNGEDPGVNQVAQRFFGLPPDIVGATLGGLGVQEVADLENYIPDNIVLGVDECLQRCGIQRTAQPNSQRQPRVSGNAFPSGIEAENVYSLAGVATRTSAPAGTPTPAAPTEERKRAVVEERLFDEVMQISLR
jgi:oxalate decarboxylase/phosphoglucose isomerase-like protein (cupin superfamily)